MTEEKIGISPQIVPLLTPALFATHASFGRWKCYQHLALINRKLMDVAAGKTKRLMILLPPRHGKSEFVSQYFTSWWLLTHPDHRIILASYGNEYASTWSRKARDTVSEFGCLAGVAVSGTSASVSQWDLASPCRGGMIAAGVDGQITGYGADLCVMDDVVKGFAEADSVVYRERTWEWYLRSLYPRLHKDGRIVIVGTRWHGDDIIGRMLEAQNSGGDIWTVVRLPAIAETDEDYSDEGGLVRKPGDALCPQLIPSTQLAQTKETLGPVRWACEFQQLPRPPEGAMFLTDKIERVDHVDESEVRIVRAWDLAASPVGDFTWGVKMGKATRGGHLWYLLDAVYGRWTPGERDRIIRDTAKKDGRSVSIVLEQEGGSAGIEQCRVIAGSLAGYAVRSERPVGSKTIRAQSFAAQVEAGNVYVVGKGDWIRRLISELAAFPIGEYDDGVDACSLAFSSLEEEEVILMFPTFGVESHVRKCSALVPGMPKAVGIAFTKDGQCAAVWGSLKTETGNVEFYDEYVSSVSASVRVHAARVKARLLGVGQGYVLDAVGVLDPEGGGTRDRAPTAKDFDWLADVTALGKVDATGRPLIADFHEAGIPVGECPFGEAHAEGCLRKLIEEPDRDGDSKLKVSPTCAKTIAALRGYGLETGSDHVVRAAAIVATLLVNIAERGSKTGTYPGGFGSSARPRPCPNYSYEEGETSAWTP